MLASKWIKQAKVFYIIQKITEINRFSASSFMSKTSVIVTLEF